MSSRALWYRVSRASLVVGRLAAAYLAVIVLFGTMLVFDGLALLALGASPPLAEMTSASIHAALLCIAIVGVFGAVQLVNEMAVGYGYTLALLAFVLGIPFGWAARSTSSGASWIRCCRLRRPAAPESWHSRCPSSSPGSETSRFARQLRCGRTTSLQACFRPGQ